MPADEQRHALPDHAATLHIELLGGFRVTG